MRTFLWTILILMMLTAVRSLEYDIVLPAHGEDLPNVQWIGCHDGDTCEFNVLLPAVFGSNLGVRLAGIDAPELLGKCDKEKQLAIQARDFLTAQMQTGPVTLQKVSRDKFFRVEATVFAGSANLNQLMITKGYAVPYSGEGPKHDWCAP